jgi:hypothetical protein
MTSIEKTAAMDVVVKLRRKGGRTKEELREYLKLRSRIYYSTEEAKNKQRERMRLLRLKKKLTTMLKIRLNILKTLN